MNKTRLFALWTAVAFSTLLHADSLVDAVARDDRKAVETLLQQKADVNAASRIGGLTPLHLAAANGSADLTKLLLQAGADPNRPSENGTTPLMLAAAAGNIDILTALLDRGAAANATESVRGQTALMFAAAENRPAAIRLLIARGADPKISSTVTKLERPRVDEDGNPLPAPTSDAAGGGRRGAAQGRAGAAGQGGTARGASATVMGGNTAMLLAARNGHLDAVKALIESGADINQPSGGESTTPIVTAICNGHYELAKYLLDRGADPNQENIDGLAALYATIDTEWAQVGWAPNPITGQEKVTYLELMKALLGRGANPNAALKKTPWFRPTHHNQEWVDKKGATPFWRAAASSDVAAMKLLVKHGANPNTASAEGVTPLMVAAGLGWGANASRNVPDSWLAAVQYCVELGADVNAKDAYNYTALHGAAYRGDNEVVKYLVAKGAALDVRSKRGQTAADMANGPMVNAHLPTPHPDTVALLIQLGAPGPEVPAAGAPRAGRGGVATSAAARPEQAAPAASPAPTRATTVEMEWMTWPEIKRAIQEEGKTTAIFFNGGTEQRGPHGITATHTFIGRTLAREIADKLGNALAAPTLPYSPANASKELPGSIGIPTPLFAAINEHIAEQLIANGFKSVVLLGDSGGGQQELGEIAKKLTAKYTDQGVRVIHVPDVYLKVRNDFNQWSADNGYPAGSHASLKDTSEMLYLGGDKWIRRDLLPTAIGDPVRKPGEPRDPNAKRVNNGISGDARRSTPEIGKMVHEMKLNYAVAQIRQLLGENSK